MSETILRQTLIMLILMAVGVLCAKIGMIRPETNKDLSKIVLQVVNPATIFMSYQTDYRPELAKELIHSFALSAAVFAALIAGAYILVRKKPGRDLGVERFSAIYSNCGFMGIPLADALFGAEGVFCLTAFITVFNIMVWTHGVILISGEKSLKQAVKVLYSPTIISIVLGIVCFFGRIRLPEVPLSAVGFIKELNTPLAMIVSGVTIASTDLKALVKKMAVWRTCGIRLIILPAVISLLVSVIPVEEKVRLVVLLAAAAPPAAMCTLFSIRYGRDSLLASEIFTCGTILSVITLPAAVRFTEFLTKILTPLCE
ncbi:MAG: AEC family transporter [Ruminococcus sp.]|nr:AEC family transporter [Ruminococcus sp.]